MLNNNKYINAYFSLALMLVTLTVSVVPGPMVRASSLKEQVAQKDNYLVYFPFIIQNESTELPPLQSFSIGPTGGTITTVVVDPTNNAIMYIGTFGGGVYKSTDKGTNWAQQITGLENTSIYSIAIDPKNTNILYAGTYGDGIFKSIDGGDHWTASSGSFLEGKVVYDIEVDPTNPNIVYSVSRPKPSLVGEVHKSTDAGLTWKLIFSASVFDSDDYFYDIDIKPNNTSVIFLDAHTHGFYKSTNGGSSFAAINSGVTDLSSRTTAIDPDDPALMYGGVWHGAGVFRSTTSGSVWTNVSNGFPTDVEIYRLYVDPFGGTVNPVFACTYENGLYRTTDKGANWNSAGLAGKFLYDFVIGSGTPKRWYAALSYKGLYLSIDNGATWASRNTNVSSVNVTGLATLASQPGLVYASAYGLGVLKTSDNGENWILNNSGLGNLSVTELFSLNGKLYALTSSAVYVSSGGSWTALNIPLTSTGSLEEYYNEVQNRVNLDEEQLNFEFEKQTALIESAGIDAGNTPLISLTVYNGILYGGTAGEGLWKYSNGAWTLVGLSNYTILSLAADNNLARLLVSACDSTGNCAVRSLENGTWTVMNEGITANRTNTLLVNGGDYYAATSNGIYLRDNNGSFWSQVGAQNDNVVSITVNSSNSCLLAAGSVGATYYSTNCGTVWKITTEALSRWNYQAVIFNPVNSNQIIYGSKEAGAFLWILE